MLNTVAPRADQRLRNAPKQDPQNWSREPLLDGFPKLEQMRQRDRATIIAQLGTPGTSYELHLPGAGRCQRRLNFDPHCRVVA